ncbi:hypothetical protein DSO57_1018821 [Entomophthora muscae]|nr:hypothetical protein DSO57_1018821 [Entomophthora muscae]
MFGIATISIEVVKLDFFVKQFGFLFSCLGRGLFYLFISFFAGGYDDWTGYIGPVFLVFLGIVYIINHCTGSELPPPLIKPKA